MRCDIEIKNYRCFPLSRPARITLGRRFTGLVGLNNAGKSALIRFFYEFRNVFAALANQDNYPQIVGGGAVTAMTSPPFIGVADQDEVFSNLNADGIEVTFEVRPDPSEAEDPTGLPVPRMTLHVDRTSYLITASFDPSPGTSNLGWNPPGVAHRGEAPFADFRPHIDLFRRLAASLYAGPFRTAINVGRGSHYDLQVGQAFIEEWDRYKSGSIKRETAAALLLQRELRRIFDFTELDINASQDGTTLQVIVDGQPYRLEELGSGIAHFVILLAFLATRRPPFLFIDEPELNLHPALQLDFLTTMGSYVQDGIVFATHSIGLARAASEIVYSVRRLGPGDSDVRELEATPKLAEFLGELSLSGYQELGFDKVLLVEGPKDVTALQRLLRLYGIEHKVVLLPLGGGSMITPAAEPQLVEITRLSRNIFGLIDSERGDPDAALEVTREGFVKACERAGIDCHVLDRRALENYFSDRAVKDVKGPKYCALEPFELLRATEYPWGKDENWRIAGAMTLGELDGTDLDAFLQRMRDA